MNLAAMQDTAFQRRCLLEAAQLLARMHERIDNESTVDEERLTIRIYLAALADAQMARMWNGEVVTDEIKALARAFLDADDDSDPDENEVRRAAASVRRKIQEAKRLPQPELRTVEDAFDALLEALPENESVDPKSFYRFLYQLGYVSFVKTLAMMKKLYGDKFADSSGARLLEEFKKFLERK